MAFNADAYVESLTPPEFLFRRRRFVGRILSVAEWLRLHTKHTDVLAGLDAARRGDANAPNAATVARNITSSSRDYIASWFPADRWYWRVLVALFGNTLNPAWRAFRQLPETVQVEAVKDFSECQRNAMLSLVSGETEATAAPPLAPSAS